MTFPLEVSFQEVQSDIDAYIDQVFSTLDSSFLKVKDS